MELQLGKHLSWVSCFFWMTGDFELARDNYRAIGFYYKMDYRLWNESVRGPYKGEN